MYCNILVTKPFDHTFTYKLQSNQLIKKGNIVIVPFGKKNDQIGIVYEIFKSCRLLSRLSGLNELNQNN